MKLERRPHIIDATLREGAQAPGVRFSIDASCEIARALVALGVDTVECGHPAVGDFESDRVRAVVEACNGVPVLAHARARLEDIEAAHATGATWVGVFLGVNDISRSARVRGEGPIPRLIFDSIRRARSLGLKSRFTIEDASRTAWPELVEAFSAALDAGANRLCLADSVGQMNPWDVEALVGRVLREFGGLEIELHLHDDRGLAGANALSAFRAGATWVSTSVNGIGERCGITDTITLLANLAQEGWREWPGGPLLQYVSQLVQAHSRLPVDRWRPVVGENATTHVARLHQRAVMANPKAYAWTSPELLGRQVCTDPQMLPQDVGAWINTPEVISATELRYHRKGPGDRYLMLDERVVSDARQYCIIRDLPALSDFGPGHVDTHRHHCDSLFLFVGREQGLRGLRVEVRLGLEKFDVESPSSVFIPSGIPHSYRVVAGSGFFINHVLSGSYDASLLGDMAAESQAWDALQAFLQKRLPGTTVSPSMSMSDVFDSLTFLDFFLYLETVFGDAISLDAVSGAGTFEDLARLLDGAVPTDGLQRAPSSFNARGLPQCAG